MPHDFSNKPKKYLTASQTLQRYGGASRMWLWRKITNESFPKPIRFGGRARFFDEEALDAWDAEMAERDQSVRPGAFPKIA